MAPGPLDDGSAPADITDDAVFNGDRSAEIFWTDPLDSDLAAVEVSCTGRAAVQVAKGEEYVLLEGLTNGLDYQVTLRSVDQNGNKSPGRQRHVNPEVSLSGAPGAPSMVNASGGDGQVTLTWADPSDPDLASVEITAPGIPSVTVPKGTGAKTLTGLTNGTTYSFQLRAVDLEGNKSKVAVVDARPLSGGTLTVTSGYYSVGTCPYPLTVKADPPLPPGTTLSWVTDTPAVATVDSNGLVTGLKKGSTRYHVLSSDGRTSNSMYLQILDATTSLTVWPENQSLQAGQTSTLHPKTTGGVYVHWETSNPDVVRVTTGAVGVAGYLQAVGEGEATVTVTSLDGRKSVTVPVVVGPDHASVSGRWVSAAASIYCAYGIKDDGSLWSWGSPSALPDRGTGRNGAGKDNPLPTRIGKARWKSVTVMSGATGEASTTYTAGIQTDGSLWLWGQDSSFNQLAWAQPPADPTNSTRWVPTQLGTDKDWVKVSGSYNCGFGLKEDGTLWGWGWLRPAAFNRNDTAYASFFPAPTKLVEGSWSDFRASAGAVYTIQKSDGTLWSWGWDDDTDGYGNLHLKRQRGTETGYQAIVRAGLARKANGELWGWNYYTDDYDGGDWFGNGGAWYGPIPTKLNTGIWSQVVQGGAGGWGSRAIMGIKTDGTLWAWDGNVFGELGNGTTSPNNARLYTATQVGGEADWAFVTDAQGVVAIKKDGSLYTWSLLEHYGGDGKSHLTPTKLPD